MRRTISSLLKFLSQVLRLPENPILVRSFQRSTTFLILKFKIFWTIFEKWIQILRLFKNLKFGRKSTNMKGILIHIFANSYKHDLMTMTARTGDLFLMDSQGHMRMQRLFSFTQNQNPSRLFRKRLKVRMKSHKSNLKKRKRIKISICPNFSLTFIQIQSYWWEEQMNF